MPHACVASIRLLISELGLIEVRGHGLSAASVPTRAYFSAAAYNYTNGTLIHNGLLYAEASVVDAMIINGTLAAGDAHPPGWVNTIYWDGAPVAWDYGRGA
eukprot:9191531-Pyramimonas_sp.AAC.1